MDYNIVNKMNVLKLEGIEKNGDTAQMQARVIVPNNVIILLRDVLAAYDEKRLGDIDDPTKVKLGKDLRADLHDIWKELNPS